LPCSCLLQCICELFLILQQLQLCLLVMQQNCPICVYIDTCVVSGLMNVVEDKQYICSHHVSICSFVLLLLHRHTYRVVHKKSNIHTVQLWFYLWAFVWLVLQLLTTCCVTFFHNLMVYRMKVKCSTFMRHPLVSVDIQWSCLFCVCLHGCASRSSRCVSVSVWNFYPLFFAELFEWSISVTRSFIRACNATKSQCYIFRYLLSFSLELSFIVFAGLLICFIVYYVRVIVDWLKLSICF